MKKALITCITGPLEPTKEPYAIAKIAGIKLCESHNRQYGRDYRSVMLTNLYDPDDNFHLENSNLIPAMLRRFHEAVQQGAKEVVVWGTGTPMREFLQVDDMAAACVHVMNLPEDTYHEHTPPMLSHVNVGNGVAAPLPSWPRPLPVSLALRAGWCSTPPSPTARRASCWMWRRSGAWAGRRRSGWKRVCARLMRGSRTRG